MGDKIIIGIVVMVVVVAHGWLFKWIKLKMDEGTIMKFLQESCDQKYSSSEIISSNTNIKISRVTRVCSKSKTIKRHTFTNNPKEKESWRKI